VIFFATATMTYTILAVCIFLTFFCLMIKIEIAVRLVYLVSISALPQLFGEFLSQ
jgi:hypothetical protein